MAPLNIFAIQYNMEISLRIKYLNNVTHFLNPRDFNLFNLARPTPEILLKNNELPSCGDVQVVGSVQLELLSSISITDLKRYDTFFYSILIFGINIDILNQY